jgi:uncharacterized iron-regulated membrane protein
MTTPLRPAMEYLHTWAGIVFSALLFLMFFMGTLSVFDRELDRWMMPSIRGAHVTQVSFDRQILPHLRELAPKASQWFALYPTERSPIVRVSWREGGKELSSRYLDLDRDKVMAEPGTLGATGFFYPFHHSFHLKWFDIGLWLTALVATGMLTLLISGVIMHKKFFVDMFTFRPDKSAHRVKLNLHTLSGVLILPFHFMITLSGMIIFMFIYLKPALPLLYGQDLARAPREALGVVSRPAAKAPGVLAPVDPMVERARASWGERSVRLVAIANPADRNAVVAVQRLPLNQVTYDTDTVYFDGASGGVMGHQRLSAMAGLQKFFSGLHMMAFSHWGLRWGYFLMGLGGCVLIASGMLLWVERRRVRHMKQGRIAYRVVNGIACAGTAGVVLATLAMLVANRALPMALGGRADIEAGVYFAVSVAAFLHAGWRARGTATRTAWREQGWAIAALALSAAVLNGVTTGDFPWVALARGDWAVAGVDLVLLASATVAAVAACRLGAGDSVAPAAPGSDVVRRAAEPA